MTIAVGMLDRVRGCWIGVNSMEKRGDTHRVVNKLVRRNGLVAAISGHMTLTDAIRDAIEPSIEGTDFRLERFKKELRVALEACGWKNETSDGQPAWRDFAFLLTDGLSLVEFSGALHAYHAEPGDFCAVGSGYEIALGAAHAARAAGNLLPELVVRRALDAAIAHGVYCGAPARVLHVEPQSGVRIYP